MERQKQNSLSREEFTNSKFLPFVSKLDMIQTEFVGQDLNLSPYLHREIARSPMATVEKNNKNSLNSDYAGRLLLDELMTTPDVSEYMYISSYNIFTCVHEKVHLYDIYRTGADIIHNNIKRSFEQEFIDKNEVKGGRLRVC